MKILSIKRKIAFFMINKIFLGTHCWKIKRWLSNWAGHKVGKGTKIVGPLKITGKLIVGENTWVGTGLIIHGNGTVIIGNNCDIAPDVVFLTGSHLIGDSERRAGTGLIYHIIINDGIWIGARSTFMGNIEIGKVAL